MVKMEAIKKARGVAPKTMATLTKHKKAVRCLAKHPREFSFVSAAADNLKKWQTRDGKFIIKTLEKEECELLLDLLVAYLAHVQADLIDAVAGQCVGRLGNEHEGAEGCKANEEAPRDGTRIGRR